MKKLFFAHLITSLLWSSYTNAQQSFDATSSRITTYNISKKTLDKQVEGTKYYDNDFKLAQVEQNENIFLRYNALNDSFEQLKDKDDIITLEKKYNTIDFKNSKEKFVLKNYIDINGERISNQYLIEITPFLYKKVSIKYIPAVEATNNYDSGKPAKYRLNKPEYIIKKDNEYIAINQKQKDLEKLFPEKAPEIKSFIKSNKIKLDKEDDLLKLTDFLNK